MNEKELEYYFDKYYSLIFRVAFAELKSHADAEDIVQEVFIKILRYKPVFESMEHEKAWMIRTAINLCRDLLGSKWKKSTVSIDKVPEAEKEYLKIPYIEQDETVWLVLGLPEKYRRPLYLFYYEDYSVKEISEAIGIPENTVKTHLRRGREVLKYILVKECGSK